MSISSHILLKHLRLLCFIAFSRARLFFLEYILSASNAGLPLERWYARLALWQSFLASAMDWFHQYSGLLLDGIFPLLNTQ